MCSIEGAADTNENFTQHVPGRIHAVKGILTGKECEKLIMDAENSGFQPSPPSGGGTWSNSTYRCTNQSILCKRQHRIS